ncbi:MAG: hypothetical protein M3O67_02595 [Bacteroidota bacterium]|nr:hypothetical protein [Bacteroidota bacterium]
MQFKDVIDQQEVKQQLTDMLQQNRLSHALLFLGKEGSGALSLAMAFAQYITCERVNRPKSGVGSPESEPSLFGDDTHDSRLTTHDLLIESCGTCASCTKAQQLVHPDIHFSYPVVTKKPGTPPISTDYITEWREFVKNYSYGNVYDWLQFIGAENKQGNITAQECGDIIRQLTLKSFESEYKILLMWMPEYLGTEGNKLLKLIEEPPANTLFILVAENESLILPTILSRCQLIRIPQLETADIEMALIERNPNSYQDNPTQARQIASISEGNYRQALLLSEHSDEDWQSLLRDWLNAMLKTGPVAQTKWVEEISRMGREKQKQFLRYFNHLLEQAIRLRIMQTVPISPDTGKGSTTLNSNIPSNEKDFADRLNKIADISQQQAIIEQLDQATYYIERNANSKILFHALTIKLYHIIQDKIVFLTT